MKGVLFCAAMVAAIFMLGGRASAMVEYCPASLAVHTIDASKGTYALLLSALSPRTLSGNIALHTEQGWYSVPFNAMKLSEFVGKWQSRGVPFTRTEFVSDYLYIRFSQPTKLLAAFVSDAKTSGETQFGWDAKGSVACAGLGDEQFSKRQGNSPKPNRLELLNPLPSPEPTTATAFLTPSISSVPGQTNCATPFVEAAVTRAQQPDFPMALRYANPPASVSVIEVAVNASGAVDDAWVYIPSGFPQFDAAALLAAKNSAYTSRRSFCENVPGQYLFRAEFSPN